jgi:hypothetical protein
VLNVVYITGLLLMTEAVETDDKRDLGMLLLLLLIAAIAAVIIGVVLEVRALLFAWRRTHKLAAILRSLPQQDPLEGTPAFYAIQIPVEEANMGEAFKPKAPSELAHLSNESKLAVVQLLTAQNEERLQYFFHNFGKDHTIPLQQVATSSWVASPGIVCAKSSKKTEESIVAKACRTTILAKNPLFGIEHVRVSGL